MGIENVNQEYVTDYYKNYYRAAKSKNNAANKGMAEIMDSKKAEYFKSSSSVSYSRTSQVSKTAGTSKTGAVSTKDMTMDEYKQYISDKISSFPKSASTMMESISITISDAGFEAMKNDPEYEKWVLDGIKQDFAFNNPWVPVCGGGFSSHYYGATKEEYHGEGWYPGYQFGYGAEHFAEKSQNATWKQVSGNSERASAIEKQKWQERGVYGGSSKSEKSKQLQKEYDKRRRQKEDYEKDLLNRQFYNNKLMANYLENQMFSSSNTFGSGFNGLSPSVMQAMYNSGLLGSGGLF